MANTDLAKFKTGLKTEFDKLTTSWLDRETALQQIRARITKEWWTWALSKIADIAKSETTPTNSEVNPEWKITTWWIPGVTSEAEIEPVVTEEPVITEEPIVTEDKTLRERVAEEIASKKSIEEELIGVREEAWRWELEALQTWFREEAASVQEDLANITEWLEAEWWAITKIAASRIREARSAPLRETLVSLVKWQELTSANLAELDTSINAILEARVLDRQERAFTLWQQIEASSLSDAEKDELLSQLWVQTEQATQRDELEALRKKSEITAQIEASEAQSISETWLTSTQNLQAATIIEDFWVNEDSIAWQSIRDLLKEWQTPEQIRELLKLSTDDDWAIDEDAFNRQKTLRTEFESSETVKNYTEAVQQFAWIIDTLWTESWTWDMAAIFQFMKVLDPSSVVREAEFDAAARSIWLWEQAKNFFSWDKLIEWAFLTDQWRQTFATIAKQLFENRKSVFDQRALQYIRLANEAWVNPASVVLDIENIPWATNLTSGDFTTVKDDDLSEINSVYWESWWFTWSSWNTYTIPAFNWGDQTSSSKVSAILWPLASSVTVIEKWWDNPVLWLSWWSLTYRTNNPLAITATQPWSAERLVGKYWAIPNVFSPDSADNLVLNFKTPEEWLKAWRQLLEAKWNLNISELMRSHTWTSAIWHIAQARKLWLDLTKTYNELTEEEKNKVIEAIKIWEWFRAWTIIT